MTDNQPITHHCEWAKDQDSIWHTSCGNAFEFTADGPCENGMLFCCYCGARLVDRDRMGEPNA